MRFDLDMGDENANKINAYETGKVKINDEFFGCSLIVSPDDLTTNWQPQHIAELRVEHVADIIAMEPDVVLIGTGTQLHFPHHNILKPLLEKTIGYEVMTTPAACRTYNVLMAEGRKVVAALIIE